MTIRRADPRRQGDIGVGAAIAWFAEHGYHICVPLFESQPYDLVVDDGKRLQRVQVKTTTAKSPYGRYHVELRTLGGNQSYHTVKHFDSSRIDLLFVLTDGGDRYVIPAASLTTRSGINLGSRYDRFRVAPRNSVGGEGFEPP
jgi:hypothetical protein